MKKAISCLSLVAALVSCNTASREAVLPEQELRSMDENSIAIEISADYTLSSYKRLIDESSDCDFVDEEIMSAMKRSQMYQKRVVPQTKALKTFTDTLSHSEQIPFCADISELTLIFEDGQAEYVQITELDPEVNPLLGFHETPLDLSHCIAKLVVKDGVATSYNTKGEVLSIQDAPRPDYSEYLKAIRLANSDIEFKKTRSGNIRDINWLRAKMESQDQTKSGGEPSYRIYEAGGDRIVLEQHVGLTKGGKNITVKTFLSSDISKNYGYEQLEGGMLTVRCTNFFDESSPATRSWISALPEMSEELPSRTVTEMISYMSDGTPMMSVSDKEYKTNTVKLNMN